MITINATNPLNVSYPTNSAVLDISEFVSEGSIEIAICVINKCNMVSTPSASRTVIMGK